MARYNLAQIQSLLRQTGWPENLIAKYAAIVMYESGGNPAVHNTTGEDSYGLLQIYYRYHTDFDRSRYADPLYNLTYAYGVYRREGDHAWLTSVGKYNRNYQGIAEQSRQIYNGSGNSNPVVVGTSEVLPIIANASPAAVDTTSRTQEIVIIAGIGLVALLIFRRY